MAATYNELLPTDLDRARSLLGDTDVEPDENALHSDEHITVVLTLAGSLAAAVAYLADELVVRFVQEPGSMRLPSGLSVSYAERVAAWRDLATRMRASGTELAPSTTNRGPRAGRLCAGRDWTAH